MSKRVNLTTDDFTAKFVNLTENEEWDGKSTGKFSITMEFDEGTPGAKKIIEAVAQADPFGGEGRCPIRYNDGKVEIKGKSKFCVRVVDATNTDLPASEITHGDTCRAEISFAAYEAGGGKGVTCYLNAVQKISNRAFGDDEYLPKDYGREGSDVLNSI